MENTEQKHIKKIVKSLKYLIIIILFQSCNGQENKGIVNYPKNKQMNTDHFNVTSFKNYQSEQEKSGKLNISEKVTLSGKNTIKEYALVSSENGVEYAKEIISPVPSLFYSINTYDEKGKIKSSIDKVFIGILDFEYGIHNFYDQEGYLKKSVDYSSQYKTKDFNLDDLFVFLSKENVRIDTISPEIRLKIASQFFEGKDNFTPDMILQHIKYVFAETKSENGEFENKILNPYNRQDVERIHINLDKHIWTVKKDYSSLGSIITLVDVNTYKIIERKYEL